MATEAKSEEREKKEICRMKLPEGKTGKKIKDGKQKRGSSCLVNTPITHKQKNNTQKHFHFF